MEESCECFLTGVLLYKEYLDIHVASLTLYSVSAVSSMDLFVLEGSPVTLTTTQHEDKEAIRNIKWYFNVNTAIVYYTPKDKEVEVEDPYKGRVKFDKTDFSLKLKNPQRNDSGLYTAVMDIKREPLKTTASYELSVLGECVFYFFMRVGVYAHP